MYPLWIICSNVGKTHKIFNKFEDFSRYNGNNQLFIAHCYGPFRKMWDMNVKIIFLKKLHFGTWYVFRTYSEVKLFLNFCPRVNGSR